MIATAILLTAVLGALWRRWLGGWGADSRSLIMACGLFLTWPLWLVLPWYWAAPAAALCLLFWAKGHRFDKWTIVLRYPVIGAAYPISRWIFGETWAGREPYAGWTAVAELAIGFLFWGAVASTLLL